MPHVFAYGSNLDISQMKTRCPSSSFVCVAMLKNYRLDFRGYSGGWRGGVATITYAPGHVVPGVVYRMSACDLMRLDAYEGVPSVYARRVVRIKAARTSIKFHVFAYQLVGWRGYNMPGVEYAKKIMRAYESWGLHEYMVGLLSAVRRSRIKVPTTSVTMYPTYA